MSATRYLLTMLFATLVSWGAFGLVLFNVDPYDGGLMGRALFLTALFFSLFGAFSIVGFLIRVWRGRAMPIYWHVLTSFRQGLLLTCVIVVSLILQATRLLNWWNTLLLLLTSVLIEVFFLTKSAKKYA